MIGNLCTLPRSLRQGGETGRRARLSECEVIDFKRLLLVQFITALRAKAAFFGFFGSKNGTTGSHSQNIDIELPKAVFYRIPRAMRRLGR